MKFLLIIIGFLFCAMTVFSQGMASWDSTSRPNVYNMLVERFQNFPPDKNDIVFLGNSITFWADWRDRLEDCEIRNQGIPGDITFGVLDRIKEVTRGKPSKIFILIGINDLSHGIPDEVILNNYRRIINKIRKNSPSTRIYFQTLLPTSSSRFKDKKDDILKINATLKAIAKEEGITCIDLYSHLVDSTGNLIKRYTWDGVHLTQKGYEEWVRVLREGHYLK